MAESIILDLLLIIKKIFKMNVRIEEMKPLAGSYLECFKLMANECQIIEMEWQANVTFMELKVMK